MSQDPISIATSEILRPLLVSHGFLRLTDRITARVVDSIVQFVSVRVSARGTRSFKLEYASISLFPPRDTLPLQPGGTIYLEQESKFFWDRVFHRKFRRTAFPGFTEEEARSSMSSLCSQLEAQAFHFFAQTESIEKLCSYLKKERWGSEHHRHFEIGCCSAKLGDFQEAERELKLAKKLLKRDGRDWCEKNVQQVQALLDAIEKHDSNTLIDDWIAESITSLNLEPIVKRG